MEALLSGTTLHKPALVDEATSLQCKACSVVPNTAELQINPKTPYNSQHAMAYQMAHQQTLKTKKPK